MGRYVSFYDGLTVEVDLSATKTRVPYINLNPHWGRYDPSLSVID